MTSLTYRIDREMRLVQLRFEERETVDVIGELVDRVVADPAFRKNMSWLIDRSDVPDAPAPDYVRGVADMLSSRLGQLGSFRIALLVRPGVNFEMALMHRSYFERLGIEQQVFTSWTQALAWVGAPGRPR